MSLEHTIPSEDLAVLQNFARAKIVDGYRLHTDAPLRKFVRVAFTATEIRKGNATPLQVLAAAARKAFVPVTAFYRYTHVVNVYDAVGAGDDVRLQWKTGTVQALSDLDTTTDIDFNAAASDEAVIHQTTKAKPVTNSDLEITILLGELAAADLDANGDGTLILDLAYDEYTV